MLQIITGKFFTTDDLYVTRHRGILYTNYVQEFQKTISTSVGTLSPATTGGYASGTGVSSLIYEYDERLEGVRPDGQREFLLSVGGDYIIQDFSAVIAFALNITCTPDFDLTRRLTQSKHASLGVFNVPNEYIGRVFDQRIQYSADDDSQLQYFVNDLVGLERQTYRSAMRAIRRYVNGLHRIADDLDLAYALLVASIESLAQDFDAFNPTWADYEQNKREALDEALAGAPDEVVQRVQTTILSHEHVALGRRYREFTLAHLRPSFFREEAAKETHPVSRPDLAGALERAYQYRSKYVHTLRERPRQLTIGPTLADATVVDGKPVLTFHGLARVARHVIREFVTRSLKVEHETFDYRKDLPNITYVLLDESLWIWNDKGYSHNSARRYLRGFLNQLSTVLEQRTGAAFTDMRGVIEKIEASVRRIGKVEQRRPMLTLYLLFHWYMPPESHRPNWGEFFKKFSKDFDNPSVESVLIHIIGGVKPMWSAGEFANVREWYFKQRYHKNGLAFGALLETAMTLCLAEVYRQAGDEARARQLVCEGVENLPRHQNLLEFESSIGDGAPLPPIEWTKILLPSKVEASDGNAKRAGENSEPARVTDKK